MSAHLSDEEEGLKFVTLFLGLLVIYGGRMYW